MIEWKVGVSVRKSKLEVNMVESPTGTFKEARFDDGPDEYLPDSFFVRQPAPSKQVRRQRPRRKTTGSAGSRASIK
jgi:hypothetical protein